MLIYAQLFFCEAKANNVLVSLPVTKKDIVIARYINGVISIVLSLIIGFVAVNINSLFYLGRITYVNDAIINASILSTASILNYFAILNPIMFKSQKNLLSSIGYICAIVAAVYMVLGNLVIDIIFLNKLNGYTFKALNWFITGSIVLYLVSLYISILIYKRKEF